MKKGNNIKTVSSKTGSNDNIEFLSRVKKQAKKANVSYKLRFKNYSNSDNKIYTYGIR